MKSIAISDFKARCLSLLEDVARTGEPILVTKRGKPLARVTPSGDIGAVRPQDSLHGSVIYRDDLLAPPIASTAFNAISGVLLSQEAGRKRARKRK